MQLFSWMTANHNETSVDKEVNLNKEMEEGAPFNGTEPQKPPRKQGVLYAIIAMFVMACIIGIAVPITARFMNEYVEPNPPFVLPYAQYAYTQPIVIPEVIDMRAGGTLDMRIAEGRHSWGIRGAAFGARIYGYAQMGKAPTFPGPTILTKAGVPITVNWYNQMNKEHILDKHIERSLLFGASSCYPQCGVPTIVHVHGQELPAKYDGLPQYAFGAGADREATYLNEQLPAMLPYHDHTGGLTRLNIWSGLVGTYIIQNETLDASLGLDFTGCDFPLILADRTIDDRNGELTYPESCLLKSKWASEAFGSFNTVNGVMMPYLEVPQQMCSFRFMNAANALAVNLTIPFRDKCKVIATDSGYVKNPEIVNDYFVIAPFERYQLACDFSADPIGTRYNITSPGGEPIDPAELWAGSDVMQIRVTTPAVTPVTPLPTILNPIKNLKDMWDSSSEKYELNIKLFEVPDADGCPTILHMTNGDKFANAMDMNSAMLTCKLGSIEKWNFYNFSPDEHPFHWHLVHAQCGIDEANVNTNHLKDVQRIPFAENRPDVRTQVCFVACTPELYLLQGSTVAANGYKFNVTSQPYLAHCHVLEHEENAMMAGFQVIP